MVRDDGMGNTGVAQLHIGAGIFHTVHIHGVIQLDGGRIIEANLVQPLADPLSGDNAGGGLHSLGFAGQTVLIAVAADTPGTIAAHLAHTAVRVEEQHPVITALGGSVDDHETVGSDGHVTLTEGFGKLRETFDRQMLLEIVQHHEIVSGAVHFPELQGIPLLILILLYYNSTEHR